MVHHLVCIYFYSTASFKVQKCHLGTDYPVQCYKPLTLYLQLCETIF